MPTRVVETTPQVLHLKFFGPWVVFFSIRWCFRSFGAKRTRRLGAGVEEVGRPGRGAASIARGAGGNPGSDSSCGSSASCVSGSGVPGSGVGGSSISGSGFHGSGVGGSTIGDDDDDSGGGSANTIDTR